MVIVRAVLTTLADTQWVELEYGMIAGGDDSVADPIAGAEVVVTNDNHVFSFSEIAPGRYLSFFRPVSRAAYELTVRTPDEAEIRGRTVIPDPPIIVDPVGETVELPQGVEELSVTWTRGTADSLQLLYLFHHPPQPSSTFVGSTTFTAARLFLGTGCGEACCGSATVVVTNPDAGLLHYMLAPGGTPAPLDGAEGVFGSMAADTILVRRTGSAPC